MKRRDSKPVKKADAKPEKNGLRHKKTAVSFLAANIINTVIPYGVLASDITGVTPDGKTYNIEAAKVSGETGFRQYEQFKLTPGDIANLQFKLKNSGAEYSKFVNLVDNQVNINGILNTMRGNNFFNGHAIFVSPAGIIIGSSGVLNVGALTLMAPSSNAYEAFKKGYSDNDYKNIKDFEFDLSNKNYQSLITNSSGTIDINGRIFARGSVNAYARTINVNKDILAENAVSPGIFAGIQDNDKPITSNEQAEALFNSLVLNNITKAENFSLEGGKIKLVTNKAENEIITTVFTSEETVKKDKDADAGSKNNEEKKKYQNTITINVINGLKTTEKKEIKEDGSGESKKETAIDTKTYENVTLSDAESSISISDAYIAANEIEIEAKAETKKEITADSLKEYSEAVKKAGSSAEEKTQKDETTQYSIHNSSKGAAKEAEAKVSIKNTKMRADEISIKADASGSTSSYIQLIDSVWEKWISLLGADLAMHLLPKLLDLLPNGESPDDEGLDAGTKQLIQELFASMPWKSKDAFLGYFSKKAYTEFEGARAKANIDVLSSEIRAASSVDITSNAEAELKLETGRFDTHPLLLYGLGSKTESKVNISESKISALNGEGAADNEDGTGEVNINAFSSIDNSIKYDSSNFASVITNNKASESKPSLYNLALINNSILSENNVTIKDESDIEAANINVKAIGFNKSETNVKNVSYVGTDSSKTGVSLGMLINHTDTKADVSVKDSNVKANYRPGIKEIDFEKTKDFEKPVYKDEPLTYGKARFIAQNIESIQNSVKSQIIAQNPSKGISQKSLGAFEPSAAVKVYDWLNKKFLGKAGDKIAAILDKASLELSGSGIWNDEINEVSSVLDGAKVNADKIEVNSKLLDFTLNTAIADANANEKFGAGAAVIVNEKDNKNTAKIIDNSEITAASSLSVDSQTQLPMNPLKLKLGTNAKGTDLYIGVSFDEGSSIDKWDTEFIHTSLLELLGLGLKNASKEGLQSLWKSVSHPLETIGSFETSMDGLFNNYAKGQSGGTYAGLGGSVIVNSIKNDTSALIDNSNINVTNGSAAANAANSVVNNDGAGKVDFLITEVNELLSKLKEKGTPAQKAEASKFGIGGSVIVQNFTNNASAKISNSKVKAKKNIDVMAASEEGYINIEVTGAKAENLAVEGSVNVQNTAGKTQAVIENSKGENKGIEAENVNVTAGKAKIKTKKKSEGLLGPDGDAIAPDDKHELLTNTARDVNEKLLNINIFGTNAIESGTGLSAGASVNVSENKKEINALIDNSDVTASNKLNESAQAAVKKFDILVSGAFTSGVKTSNMPKAGNAQQITDDANDNKKSLNDNQKLLDDNNPNKEGAQHSGIEDLAAAPLADGAADVTDKPESENSGNSGSSNNPESSSSASANFSAALAGTVNVFNDKSIVKAEIKNAVLNTGSELKVSADKDNFLLNVTGGLAKGNNIGGGAAVNIYADKGSVISNIDASDITFTSNSEKTLNVTAKNNHNIINAALGVGIASKGTGFAAAAGGSFNTNTLKDKTEASITSAAGGTKIQNKQGAQNDIDVNVKADSSDVIWNAGGDLGFAKAQTFAIGAGVSGNMDILEQTVKSEISGAVLNNVKNTYIDSVLKQEINSIAIAGAIKWGASAGFNIAGALGLELIKNNVSALLKDSEVSASGDARVSSQSDITGKTLTGGLKFDNAKFAAGAGIGAVIDIDSSTISAKIDNSEIKKSNSIEVKSNSTDKRQFLAVNLGGEFGGKFNIGISANGIISVLKTTVEAGVLNSSKLNSNGKVNINSLYDNKFEGITAVGEIAKGGLSLGANAIVNHYENDVKSIVSSNSKILGASSAGLGAKTIEYIDVIPAALAVSTGKIGGAAADVSVNIIKDKANALMEGSIGVKDGDNITYAGNVTAAADGETTLFNRGGVLDIGASSAVSLGGAVNVDKIDKTVNAQIGNKDAKNEIYSSGKVSASAVSTNALGGTKNKDKGYDRLDLTSENYQDKLLQKDANGNYTAIKYSNDFKNYNMFYSLAGLGKIAGSGAVIVKNIDDNVTAQILNAEKIKGQDVSVTAAGRTVKNIIAGSLTGLGAAAAGASILVTNDKSNISALISNSNIEAAKTLNVSAVNQKDNNLIFIAGALSNTVSGAAAVLHNTSSDNVIAKIIDDSDIKAEKLNITADENTNTSDIAVGASLSKTIALTVNPVINYYGDKSGETDENKKRGRTIAQISNAAINDAAITMNADTNITESDIVVGAALSLQGVSGTGIALKLKNDTITKSIIDNNSKINTEKDVILNANSAVDLNNWMIGVSAALQGLSAVGNVIINEISSTAETGIIDSAVTNAGNILLNTNKNKKDKIRNHGIAAAVTIQGANLLGVVSYNIYNNKVLSGIKNTSINSSKSIEAQSFTDRLFHDLTVGASAVFQGLAGGGGAVVYNVDSQVQSYIDAKSKQINTSGSLIVKAIDKTLADKTMAAANAALMGAGLSANVNLYYSDNLVSAEILSETAGGVNALSTELEAQNVLEMDSSIVTVTAGALAGAADVSIIRLGKAPEYTPDDESSKVKSSVDETQRIYELFEKNGHYKPAPADASEKTTGVISRIKGNLTAQNDISIKAESKVKGKDTKDAVKDTLDLGYVNVMVSGLTGAGNVKNVKIANQTIAGISSGKVTSENGKILLDAKSAAKTRVHGTEVDVTGLTVTYQSAVVHNNSITAAQIGEKDVNTEVNAKGDITLNSTSDVKSGIDAVHVLVSAAGLAGVDTAESNLSNRSYAVITGNTNINGSAERNSDGSLNADKIGKLTLHAASNTDAATDKVSVKVQGVNAASILKSKAEVNAVTKALIENASGTINTNGLDIITDYGKMSAYQKSNVVKVTGVSFYSADKSGAKMNAAFKSGIDSAEGLTIENIGSANIETAKYSGSSSGDDAKIFAKGEVKNVNVSVLDTFNSTEAAAENTSSSETFLKAEKHKSNSLNIKSYLDTKAETKGSSTGVRLTAGVTNISSDAKDSSTMNVYSAGSNTITGSAVISALHNSAVSSDIYGLNISLIAAGMRLRVNSELNSKTIGNLGGEFNADTADFDFKTNRNSISSIGSGSGGFINVTGSGSAETSNKLTGSSILNVDGFKTGYTLDADNKEIPNNVKNNISIKNSSSNSFEVKMTDSSGGFINVNSGANNASAETSTEINIKNSNIYSNDKIVYDVKNEMITNDSGSNKGGGFVSVLKSNFTRNYTSNADLNLENTKIHSKDIDLSAHSDIKTKEQKEYTYESGGGGFISVDKIELHNTLKQTSKIDLKNSKLYAKNNAELSADTSDYFKVKTESSGDGFVSVPKAWSYLTSEYNNKIAMDSSSVIDAVNHAVFNFNSGTDLSSYVRSTANNLGGPPSAYSYLTLTVNNELNNQGLIHTGNLTDINYLTNSNINMNNHASTKNRALGAKTWEGADLKKVINNKLIVPQNAKIASDKDIEVTYSEGGGTLTSSLSWDTYSLWCIHHGDTTYPKSISVTNSLSLDGEMEAGEGSSKYIKINRNGEVDLQASEGITENDYSLTGGEDISGDTIKNKKIAELTEKIKKANDNLTDASKEKADLEKQKQSLTGEKTIEENIVSDFKSLDGYSLLNSEIQEGKDISAFDELVSNDLKAQITGEGDNKVSAEKYNAFMNAYADEQHNIISYNIEHPDKTKSIPSAAEFLKNNTSLGLSDAQKNTISAAYNRLGKTKNGNFITYTAANGVKYAAVSNPAEIDGVKTCDEIKNANNAIEFLNVKINSLAGSISGLNNTISSLGNEITALTSERTAAENTPSSEFARSKQDGYSIVFNDIKAQGGLIKIDGAGMNNSNITGTGNFRVFSSGLKVDNYSTRSLIFNDIDLGSASRSGLLIDNKDYAKFADTAKAVNGDAAWKYVYNVSPVPNFEELPETGVHYISDSIKGITINNYYDINHPFAGTFNIPHSKTASDININGIIRTADKFNVLNESGNINIKSRLLNSNSMDLISSNGKVNIITPEFKLKENDRIFAANGVEISSGVYDVKGSITSGYSNRNIKITEDMLSNLIMDYTSEEENMIKLSGSNITTYLNETNNIKAIYKEVFDENNNSLGKQIFLYNIPETASVNGVTLAALSNAAPSGSITGAVTIADGYKTIYIDNQTTSAINIADIANSKTSGSFNAASGIDGSAAAVHVNTKDKAETSVNSLGKAVLSGVIRNGVISTDGVYSFDESADGLASNLIVQANGGGLEVKKHAVYADKKGNISSNSIYAAGTVDLLNTVDDAAGAPGSGIFIDGNIENKGAVNLIQNTKGTLHVSSTIHEHEGSILVNNTNSSAGSVYVDKDTFLYNEKGNIKIDNYSGTDLKILGTIYAPDGSTDVDNHGGHIEYGAQTIAASITMTSDEDNADIIIENIVIAADGGITLNNKNGRLEIKEDAKVLNLSSTAQNIDITNTGSSLSIKGAVENHSGGNISVVNAGDGSCDISGSIYNSNGNIFIDNKKNQLNVTGALQTENGTLAIQNNGADASIGGIASVQNGDIIIKNGLESNAPGGSKMTISADIYHNYQNETAPGYIHIENGEKAGALEITAAIQTHGAGRNIGIGMSAIEIENKSAAAGLTLNNSEISARIGNIVINNISSDMNLFDSIIENTEQGNIFISNSGGLLQSEADIKNTEGNVVITNNGIGLLQLDGSIKNDKGDTYVINYGTNTELTGAILNLDGNTSISNNTGLTSLKGSILNNRGNVTVVNNGADGSEIAGSIVNADGIIAISNSGGILNVTNDAVIRNLSSDDTHYSITVANSGDDLQYDGDIVNYKGDIEFTNTGNTANISGSVSSHDGIIDISNSGTGALKINETGSLHTFDGNIEITNTSNAGIDVTGLIQADKQNIKITNSNSDVRIGSYEDNNDKYINALTDDVEFNITNGNLFDSVIDEVLTEKHQNYDLGNPNKAYKTHIASGKDITINITDGDIGEYTNTELEAGKSFEAGTRDYTDSINVNAGGNINAKVINNNNTDDRLVNIRAKESDMKIGTVEADGNVLLTAADWKQADVRPVDKSDDAYFNGYSMLNGKNDNTSNIKGKNISLITSGNFGSKDKRLIYEQDTLNNPNNTSLSAEAENDIYLTGRANSGGDIKVNNIVSKHGSIDKEFESDAVIEHITADNGLLITQKAQNLTIKEFGTPGSAAENFDDMLYPHDDILFDGTDGRLIPKYADIKVMDAISSPDSAKGTLKIYTGYVKGNAGDNAHYYPNGARLADITLAADYIYSVSDKLQSPNYYDRIDLGNTDLNYILDGETQVKTAKGLNAWGKGGALTLDISGVDKNLAVKPGQAGNRKTYNLNSSYPDTPAEFYNAADKRPFHGSDYSARNVILSVNDYSGRDVNFDSLYTDNAFISTNKENLNFDNANVNNFAEIKNSNKTAVVDNERIGRLENTDIQLYTKKTGSFALGLDRTINMHTTAPTVYNNPHMLVNGYHSAWNFVNRGFKEVQIPINNINMENPAAREADFQVQNSIAAKTSFILFDTGSGFEGMTSDAKIYSISTAGAVIENTKGLKKGAKTQLNLSIDGIDTVIQCRVTSVNDGAAQLEFLDMPRALANKLLYRYMQANSEEINLTAL